ncbi:hypothetical protein VB776_16235 [Arcicella sp. DC2W]|uniref:Uncharacterized protein n=1 Tax=Arcicella gelida TaxID=2984195 RepID=A0ABU5S7N7_9BACT|nr:hypothetical protein [Arcicella sp. DC2W]MEA5404482.1 hypothetical protein [Arcicella sp. DC2W]
MENQTALTPEKVILTDAQKLKEHLSKMFDFNDRLQIKFLLSLLPKEYDGTTVSQLRESIR